MNKKIGMCSSLITLFSTLFYCLILLFSTLFDNNILNRGIYFLSFIIGFGFIFMIYSYCVYMKHEDKIFGLVSLVISIMHCILFCLINHIQYFELTVDTIYRKSFFNIQMFGYVLMSMSTIFIGLTLPKKNKTDSLLKNLLIAHSVFGLYFIVVLFGMLFNINDFFNNNTILIIQCFWCLYLSIISILSFIHFKNKQ